MAKHKLITELRDQYATAECLCGWNLFLNQKRGKARRLQSLKENYKRHLQGATND